MKKGSHRESYHNLHLTQGGLTQHSLPPLPICAPQQLLQLQAILPHQYQAFALKLVQLVSYSHSKSSE